MIVLNGLLQVVAVVVIASGAAKLVDPTAFADLLATMRVGSEPALRTRVARTTGVFELGLGTWVIVSGGPLAAAVLGLAYVGFVVAAERARRLGATSCGCFGSVSAPPSLLHVAVNAASVIVCAAAAALGANDDLLTVLSDQPLAGVPYLAALLLGAGAVIALDTSGGRRADR